MTARWEVTQEEQRERRLRMQIDGVPTLEHLRRLLLTAQDAGFSPTAELKVPMWTAEKSQLILTERSGSADETLPEPEQCSVDILWDSAAQDVRAEAFRRSFLP
jgi:hypothetical protein